MLWCMSKVNPHPFCCHSDVPLFTEGEDGCGDGMRGNGVSWSRGSADLPHAEVVTPAVEPAGLRLSLLSSFLLFGYFLFLRRVCS